MFWKYVTIYVQIIYAHGLSILDFRVWFIVQQFWSHPSSLKWEIARVALSQFL